VVVDDQHGWHDLSIFAPGGPAVFSASPEAGSVTARMAGGCPAGTFLALLLPVWLLWTGRLLRTDDRTRHAS
jgi:hypothetical protein